MEELHAVQFVRIDFIKSIHVSFLRVFIEVIYLLENGNFSSTMILNHTYITLTTTRMIVASEEWSKVKAYYLILLLSVVPFNVSSNVAGALTGLRDLNEFSQLFLLLHFFVALHSHFLPTFIEVDTFSTAFANIFHAHACSGSLSEFI